MRGLRIRVVARKRRGRGMGPYVAGSLLVHVVLGGLLILLPSLRGQATIPQDAIFVELAAVAPAAAPRVQAPTAPPVAPEPQPEIEQATPEEAHVVEDLPDPEPVKKPEPTTPKPKPRPQPTTPAPDPGEASNATPGGVAGESQGPGTSIASDLGGVEFAWYGDQVRAALRSHWRPPPLPSVRRTIGTLVTFEILRDGTVRNPRILESSGIPSYDRSVLRALIDSQPLPPLPGGWRRSSMTGTMQFQWSPET